MEERKRYAVTADVDDRDKDVYEWLQCVVVALTVCIVVFTFFFSMIDVVGYSMYPTLDNSDKIIISRFSTEFKQGDIVVFRQESFKSEPIVKRVIAVAGQTVDIDFEKGVVYVDNIALDEPYINEPTYKAIDFTEPITVPEDCVFVLGDNRNNSQDSRYSGLGCVNTGYIIGKVIFRVLPINNIGAIYGW